MAVSVGKQYKNTKYYMEDPIFQDNGVLIGGLHKTLGFKDKMTAKTLRALQKGQDAKGNQVATQTKVKNEETGEVELKHNAGKDATFSIDKSISLLYASNPEMRPAVEAAAKAASLKMLKTAIEDGKVGYREHVRDKTKGIDRMDFHAVRDINSYVIASFIQSASRANDMDIHVHNAFMNMVLDEQGKVRAVCFDPLFENDYVSKYLDPVAKNEFYQVLSKETGLDFMKLTDTDRNTNITKLHNVSQDTLDKFSTRKNEMKKYVDEKGLGNDAKSKQHANLMTRERKKPATAEEMFKKVEPHFDEINAFQEKNYINRDIKDVVKETITAKSEKEIFTNFYKLTAEILKENRNYSLKDVRDSIGELAKEGFIVERDFESSEMKFKGLRNVTNKQFATTEMVKIEKDFQAAVADGKGESFKIDENQLIDVITSVQDGLKNKYGQDFSYSTEQARLFHSVFVSGDKFIAAQGYGGTGKTVSYEGIKKIADANGIKVYGFANAGSQAATLQKKAGIESQTLKDFIVKNKKDVEKVDGKTLITLDEASMAGIKDLWDFKQALDAKFNDDYKLVIVGDKYQNLSISAGLGFTNLIDKTDKNALSKVLLKNIQRQKNEELKSSILDYYKQFESGKKINGKSIFNSLQSKGFIQITDKPIEAMEKEEDENDEKKHKDNEKPKDLKTEITEKYLDYVNKDGIDQTKIVVRSNYAKDIFDKSIHSALQEKGNLGKNEYDSVSYRKVNIDDVAKLRAESFHISDIISLKKNQKSVITNTDKMHDTISVRDIQYISDKDLIGKNGYTGDQLLKLNIGDKIKVGGKEYQIDGHNTDKTIFKFKGKEYTVSLRDKEQTEQLQVFKKIDVKFSKNEQVETTDNIKITTDKDVFDKKTVKFYEKGNYEPEAGKKSKGKGSKMQKFGDELFRDFQNYFDPRRSGHNLDNAINQSFSSLDRAITKSISNFFKVKNKKRGREYKQNRIEITKDKNGNKLIKEIINTDQGTFVIMKHFKKEKIELKNREQLTITDIDTKKGTFTFESNLHGKITLDLNKIDNLKAFETLNYAYTSTIEAAQGIDAKNIIGVELEKFQNANQYLVFFSRAVQNIVSYYKVKPESNYDNELKRAYDKFSIRQEKTTSIDGKESKIENSRTQREQQTPPRAQKEQAEDMSTGLSF